jgi:hypothetical protein
MKKLEKSLRLLFILLVILAGIAVVSAAKASGDCKGQSCNGGGTDVTVGGTDVTTTVGPTNVTTGSMSGGDLNNESLAIALSNSLGDVDIAGCLGSTQWATPLFSKQKLVVNWPCLTEFYLRNGKYELASMAICNTEIVKEFATEAECEAAHNFGEMFEPEVVMVEPSDEHYEEEREWHEEQMMLQQDYDERIAQLEQRMSRPRQVVEQKPLLTEDQKKRLQEVLDE